LRALCSLFAGGAARLAEGFASGAGAAGGAGGGGKTSRAVIASGTESLEVGSLGGVPEKRITP
jgi:hypothetical protein